MENTTTNPAVRYTSADPVPVKDAAEQTASWRAFMDKYAPPGTPHIYAFSIPIGDLTELMKYAVDGMRVYFALRTPGDLSTLHLLGVPIDGAGDDIITINGESVIYDTTLPCPTLCSSANPLNPLGADKG